MAHAPSKPDITAFFDPATFTVTYLVIDPTTRVAAVIDPVADYDHASGRYSLESAKAVLAAAHARRATITHVLETHVHADHLSAGPWFKAQTGAKVVIGARVDAVQSVFRTVFDAPDVSGTGAEFDLLVEDGDVLDLGALPVTVMHVPGHTPACVAYHIGDSDVFVGDTLFMPDFGTARADFPGGDARLLYRSIRKLLAMPEQTTLWMCHDYKAPGREGYAWQTTVGEQRRSNIHVHDGIDEDTFVAMRTARDCKLAAPALLLPSVQVNMRAGHMPPPSANGGVYLKVPVSLAG
ncbi:MAG: MBL fold metallo-hydrolase [Hyphomonadaceae bacterium]|jgi:glyoxylase-like metal-dependent hydrolase (beta-lactamase superfamily II)|nr:MBL fold metallo-hydrolase [Hyphomonadaceae bacterium]